MTCTCKVASIPLTMLMRRVLLNMLAKLGPEALGAAEVNKHKLTGVLIT